MSKSKCKKHFSFGALLEAAMSKKCKPLWREAHFEVKMCKAHQLRTTFRSCDVEKVHAVVAWSTCRSQKMQKNWRVWSTFGRSDVVCVAGARDCAPFQKWARREGFVAVSKALAGVGHLKRICKHVAGAVQETCSSGMLGGPGADFLRRVPFWSIRSSVWEDDFAWQVQHFVWPGLTFSWQAQYFRQIE